MEWRYKHTTHRIQRKMGPAAFDDLLRAVSAVEDEGWELMSVFQADPGSPDNCCIAACWRQATMTRLRVQ
jgi:hypothetical protein